ncbi:MAG: molybdopterin-guanine dinucleotide biosynthesis protein B [Candidatus Thermoplasmatota archaeon]|nr:molybdopterin-guanine dinucleotide biosynthesis protein B [Candidatus Thermoplasmatota archaeon]
MNESVIVGFYGFSNAGKTTLITNLITQLTEKNFKVASVKQTNHSYSIDSPGKDTWKHAKAGADLVCFQTEIETSFIVKQQMSIEKIKQIMNCFNCFDIILVEGAKDKDIQKIRLDEETPLRENTLFTFDGDVNKIISIIEKQRNRRE